VGRGENVGNAVADPAVPKDPAGRMDLPLLLVVVQEMRDPEDAVLLLLPLPVAKTNRTVLVGCSVSKRFNP
jgi:hypothetical protein